MLVSGEMRRAAGDALLANCTLAGVVAFRPCVRTATQIRARNARHGGAPPHLLETSLRPVNRNSTINNRSVLRHPSQVQPAFRFPPLQHLWELSGGIETFAPISKLQKVTQFVPTICCAMTCVLYDAMPPPSIAICFHRRDMILSST